MAYLINLHNSVMPAAASFNRVSVARVLPSPTIAIIVTANVSADGSHYLFACSTQPTFKWKFFWCAQAHTYIRGRLCSRSIIKCNALKNDDAVWHPDPLQPYIRAGLHPETIYFWVKSRWISVRQRRAQTSQIRTGTQPSTYLRICALSNVSTKNLQLNVSRRSS